MAKKKVGTKLRTVTGQGFRFVAETSLVAKKKRYALYPGPASEDVDATQFLGYIYWNIDWERYCYDPGVGGIGGVTFDAADLKELAEFLHRLDV